MAQAYPQNWPFVVIKGHYFHEMAGVFRYSGTRGQNDCLVFHRLKFMEWGVIPQHVHFQIQLMEIINQIVSEGIKIIDE